MTRLLTILLFVSVSFSAVAQKASLSGTVREIHGPALPAAAVYIHDIKALTHADSAGRYRFSSIPAGVYLVEVTYVGYAPVTEMISLKGDVVHDFTLEHSVVEQPGVIVTGVATATRMKQATQPVNVVRRSDLLKTTSSNIIDALTSVPGVSALGSGPAISKPVIRGLGYNRMVVINDGIRQEGQQWGDEHGIEIDEYSVHRVEILKGPASLMYGSDAMAGVINILSNLPVEQGTMRGNIFAGFGSNNEQLGLHASLAGNLKNGFNWNAYGSMKNAGDYRNRYDGRVLNSRFNEANTGGYVGLNKRWGFSHLLFTFFDQRVGLVEGERDSATGRFIIFPESPLARIAAQRDLDSKKMLAPYQHIRHLKLTSDNSFRLPKGRINVLLGVQRNQRREYGDPEAPGMPGLYFDLRTLNYSIQFHSPSSKSKWATSAGVNGMYQQNFNRAAEVLIPEYSQFDIGAFVYTRKSFGKYALNGGIRTDLRTMQADEFAEAGVPRFGSLDKKFSNISGSVGLSWQPGDELTVKLNVARGFRAPNIAELSSNGAHEGTNRYEYGQQDLSSETSMQLDAGMELNTMHVSISAAVFYNNIQNYIFYRKLLSASGGDSIVVVDGEDHTAFRFDQSAASLYGFEVGLDLHPHPLDWLHVETNFSFVRGQFHSAIAGDRDLPFMPAARWNNELRMDFRQVSKPVRNFYLRVQVQHTLAAGAVFGGYDTETKTPAYTLLNLGAGMDIHGKRSVLFSMHASVDNATDVAYQNHLSRLKYAAVNNTTGRQGVFNMGRNFSLKMNIPLNWRLDRAGK